MMCGASYRGKEYQGGMRFCVPAGREAYFAVESVFLWVWVCEGETMRGAWRRGRGYRGEGFCVPTWEEM